VRIAYLCADFGIPIRGHKGASVHVREMVTALTAEGHDVRVFSPNASGSNHVAAPLHAVSPDGLPETCRRLVRRARPGTGRLDKEVRELVYNVTFYRAVGKALASWCPDAVYERYSLFNFAGVALARQSGVPHLLEVNAPLRLERAETRGLTLDRVAAAVERRVFGSADAVLTVTAALKRYVLTRGGRAERTRVLQNAVDVDRFAPARTDRQAARARWGLSEDALVIGFAGSLKPWHGTDTLLDAFGQLHGVIPGVHLLMVGEGPMGETLRERAAERGLSTAVTFTGAVDHSDMPHLLAGMDIGVAPYLDAPNFYFSPLKIYEYMAAALPVVASDAGDIGSLVRDGETGLLCTPGDAASLASALQCLIAAPRLRAALSVAARAEAERHTWRGNARVVAKLAADPPVLY
jgi:glycosyltransferase involved in cell wall biosynthesis